MSTRAIRPAILLSTAALACALAGMAQAQTAPGPRYMSWAGRPANTTPANVVAEQAQAHSGMIPRRIAPSQTVARPMMQPAPTPRPVSNGLTPASAWLGPQPVSSFAPGSPDPLAYTREMTAPVPVPVMAQPPVQSALRQPQPDFLPNQGAAVPTVAQTPQPAPMAAADPMAPRADALIFRLRPQGPAQQPTAQTDQAAPQVYAEATPPTTTAQPGQQGSRYYSVHRDAGHAPDHTPLPEAVFYDSVALDLAQPPETEVPQRDAQGRLRAPARSDDPERP